MIKTDEEYRKTLLEIENFPLDVEEGSPEEDYLNSMIEDVQRYEKDVLKIDLFEDDFIDCGNEY